MTKYLRLVAVLKGILIFHCAAPAQDSLSYERYLELGRDAIQNEFYEAALAHLDVCVFLQPDEKEALYERGIAYMYLDDFESAVKDFDRVLKIDVQDTITYLNRGISYFYLGDLENAIRDIGDYLRVVPANKEAQKYYDIIRRELKEQGNNAPDKNWQEQQQEHLYNTDLIAQEKVEYEVPQLSAKESTPNNRGRKTGKIIVYTAIMLMGTTFPFIAR